ncbi:MAG: hypothetical protein AAFV47_06105 [Pseudomonadota bacterium]
MNKSTQSLFDINPKQIAEARVLVHLACQPLSRAARANRVAESDDSHSSFGWHAGHNALITLPLDPAQRFQLGFGFSDVSLLWLEDDRIVDRMHVADFDAVSLDGWVDQRLAKAGLVSICEASMPYALDAAPDFATLADMDREVRILGDWFGVAHEVLTEIIQAFGELAIQPLSIRCWPHHFDLAILIQLDEGDVEAARSVGVGLSPGDEHYDQPYFYCSPWPVSESIVLPELPPPLRWHTQGFTSAIALAVDLHSGNDFGELLVRSVDSVLQTLGAGR